MDERTGEIVEIGTGNAIPAGHTPLTAREHEVLIGREAKNRIWMLKVMRKQAIKAKKKILGRRLLPHEMKEVLGEVE
jgi:hypothetical protein